MKSGHCPLPFTVTGEVRIVSKEECFKKAKHWSVMPLISNQSENQRQYVWWTRERDQIDHDPQAHKVFSVIFQFFTEKSMTTSGCSNPHTFFQNYNYTERAWEVNHDLCIFTTSFLWHTVIHKSSWCFVSTIVDFNLWTWIQQLAFGFADLIM